MPLPRGISLLALALLLTGCNDRALRQRTDQIRDYSNKEDRVYAAEALSRIQHKYWTVHNHAWLGKLADGTIIRLDSHHATAAPLPSRAFYSGWHLQLTISSDDWRTYPASAHQEPFRAVYAITRHSATSWDIDVTEGPATAQLRKEDAGQVEN